MKRKYKISLVIGILLLFLLCGYFLRLDKFGFVSIHWVDFIKYKKETYTAVMETNDTRQPVSSSEIGEKIGEVKYTLQGNVRSTYYKFRNFDASFLDKGTPIYRLKGEKYKNCIAVNIDGVYYMYQLESHIAN